MNRTKRRMANRPPRAAPPAGPEDALNGDGVQPYSLILAVWDGDTVLDLAVLVADADLATLKRKLVALGTAITTIAISHAGRHVGLKVQKAASDKGGAW
jgi:hypothetical protein